MIIDRESRSGLILGEWSMFVCLDGHDHQLAPVVIDTISEQSEETLRVMMESACMEAWRGASKN